MKKMSVTRHALSLFDTTHGEKYATILRYFFPELITALILNLTLTLIDAKLVANLKSTSLYATPMLHRAQHDFLREIGTLAAYPLLLLPYSLPYSPAVRHQL